MNETILAFVEEPAVARWLRDTLEPFGFQVHTADPLDVSSNGESAIPDGPFDMVIVDVRDLDCYSTVRECRQSVGTRNATILVLSPEEDIFQFAHLMGGDAVLGPICSRDTVTQLVREIVDSRSTSKVPQRPNHRFSWILTGFTGLWWRRSISLAE